MIIHQWTIVSQVYQKCHLSPRFGALHWTTEAELQALAGTDLSTWTITEMLADFSDVN